MHGCSLGFLSTASSAVTISITGQSEVGCLEAERLGLAHQGLSGEAAVAVEESMHLSTMIATGFHSSHGVCPRVLILYPAHLLTYLIIFLIAFVGV